MTDSLKGRTWCDKKMFPGLYDAGSRKKRPRTGVDGFDQSRGKLGSISSSDTGMISPGMFCKCYHDSWLFNHATNVSGPCSLGSITLQDYPTIGAPNIFGLHPAALSRIRLSCNVNPNLIRQGAYYVPMGRANNAGVGHLIPNSVCPVRSGHSERQFHPDRRASRGPKF
jgi:hypothetical protein